MNFLSARLSAYCVRWCTLLEQQQVVLLTRSTLTALYTIIAVLRKEGKSADTDNWEQYPRLLEEAISRGIDNA